MTIPPGPSVMTDQASLGIFTRALRAAWNVGPTLESLLIQDDPGTSSSFLKRWKQLNESGVSMAAFVWACLGVLTGQDPEPAHYHAGGIVLKRDKWPEDDSSARDRLARSIVEHTRELRLFAGFLEEPPKTEEEALKQTDGTLHWDEMLARFLERRGETGMEAAAAVRDRSAQRLSRFDQQLAFPGMTARAGDLWHSWCDLENKESSLPFLAILAEVVWHEVIKPEITRERRLSQPPALLLPIFNQFTQVQARSNQLTDSAIINPNGVEIAILQRVDALNVPAMEVEAIGALLKHGAGLLDSLHAHRLIRHVVTRGHQQVLNNSPDARALVYDGGWSELARQISGHSESISGKIVKEFHALVVACAHLCWQWPDGTMGNPWSYTFRPHAPGRSARVTLVLGDILLPYYGFNMQGNSRRARESRRLVPIIPLPTLIGREREHASQAAFQLRLLALLTCRATEIVAEGGVHIPLSDLVQLGREAGLPPKMVREVMDAWTQDKHGEPFLEVTGPDRYHLSSAAPYAAARTFLEEAGSESLSQQERGRRTTKTRKRSKLTLSP